ncbi:MAG TPA: universal stress protein [Geminicoccaceae bacterium]
MNQTGPILVALELADADRHLIEIATAHARALSAKLYLIHVVAVADQEFVGMPKDMAAGTSADDPEVGYAYDRAMEAERAREQHADLGATRAMLDREGLEATALQLAGVPGEKVVEEAKRLGAGLIVAGHRNRTVLGEMVFGSTSRDILRAAPCPVLLVPMPA